MDGNSFGYQNSAKLDRFGMNKIFFMPIFFIKRSSLAESGYRNPVLAGIHFSITELVRLSRFDCTLMYFSEVHNVFFILECLVRIAM